MHRLPAFLTAIYACALWSGTHWPRADLSFGVNNTDKALHVIAYAVLAVLCRLTWATLPALAVQPRTPLFFLTTLLVAGGIDELTQIPVPGRQACIYDWMADGVGIVLGLGLFGILWKFIGRTKASHRAQIGSSLLP